MNIYVGNLSYKLTEEELKEEFAKFGEVISAKIISDRETGRPKGFGFIEMANQEEAEKAMQELSGRDIKGREIRVNEARPRN